MSRIENIKYLRQIGASLKLQDDVANRVGGYDSPLFVPTVEFILKLQNSFLSQSQQQEQGISTAQMPNTFDPDIFKGVDLELASDIVKSDDMPKAEKKKAVAYINNMAKSRDKFLADNPDFDAEKNLIPTKKKDKKQKLEQQKEVKKSGLISIIVNAVKSMNDKMRQNAEIANLQSQQAQRQSSQTQQSSQQSQKSVREIIKEAARKNVMSLFKTKKGILENDPSLIAAHKRPKDNIVADKKTTREEFLKKLKSDQRIQAMHQQEERLGHRITDDDLLEAAKAAKHQMADASKDLIISKMIDNIVKANAQKKDSAKTKDANIDDAVAKLSNIGVKPIDSLGQQINNKKALEDQQKAMADQQKQRG